MVKLKVLQKPVANNHKRLSSFFRLIPIPITLIFLIILLSFPSALWAQARWTIYSPPSPDARDQAACIRAGNALVICGGWDASQYLNEVYRLILTPGKESWEKLQPGGIVFPQTADHSAVWDSVNNRMVVFAGGDNGGGRSDVYVLNLTPGNETWQRLSPSGIIPAPRINHTAIYDPLGQRMVVFGGMDNQGNVLGDVQFLDLRNGQEAWSVLHPQGLSPSGRAAHSVVYDAANHRMVIFGGVDSTWSYVNDVWSLDLTLGNESWTRLSPSGTPPQPMCWALDAYDQANQRMVLGYGHDGSWIWSDVYSFDLRLGLEAWSRIDSAGPKPTPRTQGCAVYDPFGHRMITFGGLSLEGYVCEARTMDLTLGSEHWTIFNPQGTAPAGRNSASLIYDPANSRAILFGGGGGGGSQGRSDVYALDLTGSTPKWLQLFPSGPSPAGRWMHSAIRDGSNNRMVVFAGYNEQLGDFNDSWAMSLASGSETWKSLSPSGFLPSPRDNHVAVYDSVNNRMVTFGGEGQAYNNDTHALGLTPGAEHWDSLAPQGSLPLPREGACAVYDPLHHCMLTFGGQGNSTYFKNTYRLTLSSGAERWDSLTTTGPLPRPRFWCSGAWDTLNHRMIVFGGHDGVNFHNDVFAFTPSDSGGKWDSLAPLGTPPTPVDGPAAIYDPHYQRMIVFGGNMGHYPWVSRDLAVLSLPLVGVEEPSSVAQRLTHKEVRAVPNPFTSFASVPGHYSDRFSLYDISGRMVGVYKGDRIGEGLTAGVYFLKPQASSSRPLRIVKVR